MGEVKAAMEELSAAYQEAGRSLYSQQQGAAAEGAPQGEPADASAGATEGAGAEAKKQDDVVEADYEIVDETKKN
jgi:molecular chaperone DnaK